MNIFADLETNQYFVVTAILFVAGAGLMGVNAGNVPRGYRKYANIFALLGAVYGAIVQLNTPEILIFMWVGYVCLGALIGLVVGHFKVTAAKRLLAKIDTMDNARPAPSGADMGGNVPPVDDSEFAFDASSFEGAGDTASDDENLWSMARDPRTPEGERQNAMRLLEKRATPKQITHKR